MKVFPFGKSAFLPAGEAAGVGQLNFLVEEPDRES